MKSFQKFIAYRYGDSGQEWLSHLPVLVDEVSKKYGLSNLRPLANLSYHYVLEGWQNQTPIILKIGLDNKGLALEASALEAFSSYGAVNLLEEFPGGLLLERIIPGTSLKSYFPSQEQESLDIFCRVMKRLHQAPLPDSLGFPHVKSFLKVFDTEKNIPLSYLRKARERRDILLKTSGPLFLLHGDLHHDNILKNSENWLAIDPKGVIGEIEYEVAKFIQNPLEDLFSYKNADTLIYNRLRYFTEALSLDFSRLKDWCFVSTVLGWIWAEEDGQNHKLFENLALIFY